MTAVTTIDDIQTKAQLFGVVLVVAMFTALAGALLYAGLVSRTGGSPREGMGKLVENLASKAGTSFVAGRERVYVVGLDGKARAFLKPVIYTEIGSCVFEGGDLVLAARNGDEISRVPGAERETAESFVVLVSDRVVTH